MARFRKKPVVVEATVWARDGDHREVSMYCGDSNPNSYRHCEHCDRAYLAHGWVRTLEGGHIVCPGDWIIRGIKGEIYPCKPDIFAATYEPAD